MASFRNVPLVLLVIAATGCKNVTRPGVQIADTRSVLLETVVARLPDGAVGKTTYPHGSRNTRYAAVLIVGDYSCDIADDENPGSERLLASWAEGLGQEKMLTLRITDDAPTQVARQSRVLAAWETLRKGKLVDPSRVGILVQGDAFYTVAPLLGRLDPQAIVLAGCPARPFKEVALERALLALQATDGSLPESSVRAGLAEWEAGNFPRGPFWTATFGDSPPGYFRGDFMWRLPGERPVAPVLAMSGDADREGSDRDARLLESSWGAKVVLVPLTNRQLKPRDDRNLPGPTDGVVPDAVEATLEFLAPILRPSDLREG
ncbi:MAG: hypothetical protein IT207_00480 [Fimbriimonadaceae bacterium]|nr:hypothetical protein [Fimbriimonadaceae bacterium]